MSENAFIVTSPSTARDAPTNNAVDRFATTVEFLQSNLAEIHTVSTLAKYAGMSRSNFAAAFRRHLGRSPMELLRSTRLEHAAKLLSTISLSIKIVGARVGYDSRTSFAIAFKRTFGQSPLDYRVSHSRKGKIDIHALSERLRGQHGSPSDLAWEVNLSSGVVCRSSADIQGQRRDYDEGYDDARREMMDRISGLGR